MAHSIWRSMRLCGMVAATLVLSGCQAQLKEGAIFRLEDVISGVTDAGGTVHATLNRGAPPAASGATTVTASGIAVMINGGSSVQTLAGSAAFSRVIVAVEGLDGWYDLTLPASTASADIILSANTLASSGTIHVRYGVGDAGGVGPQASQSVAGEIQAGDIHVDLGQVTFEPAPGTNASLRIMDEDGIATNRLVSVGHKGSDTLARYNVPVTTVTNLVRYKWGTLIFGATNTFTGTFTIEGGLVKCAVPYTLGATNSLVLANNNTTRADYKSDWQ